MRLASEETGIGALYVLRQLDASSRALLTKCLPSGNRPEWTCNQASVSPPFGNTVSSMLVSVATHTAPTCLSTVAIRLFASFFSSLLDTSFSNAKTTPSLHLMPIAVPPFSTAFTAYST